MPEKCCGPATATLSELIAARRSPFFDSSRWVGKWLYLGTVVGLGGRVGPRRTCWVESIIGEARVNWSEVLR